MVRWVRLRWQAALDGFLLVPGAIALAYVCLALALVRIDRSLGAARTGYFFGGDAGAARGILETIAGSLITVAGLAFSLTIVVLALVSSQFSPRATPGFLADRLNQAIAGTFVGVFGYCLVMLRSVRSEVESTGEGFIPRLGVTVAIFLAVGSLGLLLIFIHHLGTAIQISRIAARIAAETSDQIEDLHPERGLQEARSPQLERDRLASVGSATVQPREAGFVQSVALEPILGAVRAPGVCLSVRVRAGDFVTASTPMVEVWPASALTEDAAARIRRGVTLGKERSIHDDALYGVRQLADIAVKALSPGVNDPTTAIDCIGYLRDLLERLAARELPETVGLEREGALLVAVRPTFEDYLTQAFAEAGLYASSSTRVIVVLLDALHGVARVAQAFDDGRRADVVAELAATVCGPALEDARTIRDTNLIEDSMAWTRQDHPTTGTDSSADSATGGT